MKKIDYLQLAKAAQVAAAECIATARRNDPQCHHVHRGVDVLALDQDGERIGDTLDIIDVKQISGKRLREIVTNHAPAQYHSICVQGGLDCYESFAEAMRYPEDYEPLTDCWDVDSNDQEAIPCKGKERIPNQGIVKVTWVPQP
jgi:hypothetical protein